MSSSERNAVAWWMEVDGAERFVCFDTDHGDTVVFDVSEANFGGEIQK